MYTHRQNFSAHLNIVSSRLMMPIFAFFPFIDIHTNRAIVRSEIFFLLFLAEWSLFYHFFVHTQKYSKNLHIFCCRRESFHDDEISFSHIYLRLQNKYLNKLCFWWRLKLFLIGAEYGTSEAAWKGILTESDRISDLHMNIKDQLCNDVTSQIRVWQKDNYHKVSRLFVWHSDELQSLL